VFAEKPAPMPLVHHGSHSGCPGIKSGELHTYKNQEMRFHIKRVGFMHFVERMNSHDYIIVSKLIVKMICAEIRVLFLKNMRIQPETEY
jgi:hypothetical protein